MRPPPYSLHDGEGSLISLPVGWVRQPRNGQHRHGLVHRLQMWKIGSPPPFDTMDLYISTRSPYLAPCTSSTGIPRNAVRARVHLRPRSHAQPFIRGTGEPSPFLRRARLKLHLHLRPRSHAQVYVHPQECRPRASPGMPSVHESTCTSAPTRNPSYG